MWEFVLNKKVHIAEFMVHITSQEIDSAMHEKMFFFIINISWCVLLMLYWDVVIALTCRGNIDTYHWIWESEEIQDYLPLADWIGILRFYFSDPTAQWFPSQILSATVNKWINMLVLKITHLWTYHNNYKYNVLLLTNTLKPAHFIMHVPKMI